MMNKLVFTTILLAWVCGVSGQNLLDEQGRKTGFWKEDYPNGRTRYEGEFRDGQPVGELVRYYESGLVRARMQFSEDGKSCFTRMFYPSGKLAAEGKYLEQNKDSVWTHYSPQDASLVTRENYVRGKLEGLQIHYYYSGGVSEETQWKEGRKEGSWKQYYPNGDLRLEASYEKDLLNGPYRVYFGAGKIKIRGSYKDGLSHGNWIFFTEDGEEVHQVEYRNGSPVHGEAYDRWMNDSLQKYMPEPDDASTPIQRP